ncbi:MAG: hypothetical protein JJ902_04180 [Roseibium sp.]|nr:hypothetical protein [Roseibium sp.]
MRDVLSMQRKTPLDCIHVGRATIPPNSLIVAFNRVPTDKEVKWINDCLKRVISLQMEA